MFNQINLYRAVELGLTTEDLVAAEESALQSESKPSHVGLKSVETAPSKVKAILHRYNHLPVLIM